MKVIIELDMEPPVTALAVMQYILELVEDGTLDFETEGERNELATAHWMPLPEPQETV